MNEDTEITPEGGVQARVDGRFDLVPPEAILAIARIMEMGIKRGYTEDNWRKISLNSQLNHAIAHIIKFMMKIEDGEDHLAHALTRLAMAISVRGKE